MLSFLIASALASGQPEPNVSLVCYSHTVGQETVGYARVGGAAGHRFSVFAAPASEKGFDPDRATLLAHGGLDKAGNGLAAWSMKRLPDSPGFELDLWAVWFEGGSPLISDKSKLPIGNSDCEVLDFDYTIGFQEPVKGQIIDEQWALIGLHISAINNIAGHPDTAIIFDSMDVSGGDPDLATPGPGPGNNTPLGKLLILAEDVVDADGDGLVDDPDDEAGGGVLRFDFDFPAQVCSITLVDIDDGDPTELVFTHSNGQTTVPVANAGDNSVQRILTDQKDVLRMDVVLGGSGGIAEIELDTCPKIFNFDETPTGIPLVFAKAGLQVTDQYFDRFGVRVSADNAFPNHPDKAILFDSGNPTGGDTDLMTPGYGMNNDTPLGLIMIIAENDVDMDGDGCIDDPDDERGGGSIDFRFEEDVTVFGATVLDVDGSEVDMFIVYDEFDNMLGRLDLVNLGDNSVQRVEADPPFAGVRRVELVLGGSGAVTRLRWCPESSD